MDIPFLIWRSSKAAAASGPALPGVPAQTLTRPQTREGAYSHDHVFHTVMGALGLRSGVYRADQDVLQDEARTP